MNVWHSCPTNIEYSLPSQILHVIFISSYILKFIHNKAIFYEHLRKRIVELHISCRKCYILLNLYASHQHNFICYTFWCKDYLFYILSKSTPYKNQDCFILSSRVVMQPLFLVFVYFTISVCLTMMVFSICLHCLFNHPKLLGNNSQQIIILVTLRHANYIRTMPNII